MGYICRMNETKKPLESLKLRKLNTNYIVIEKPLMIGPTLWWFPIKNTDGYAIDIWVTSNELYELYGDVTNSIDFDDFLTKAKSGNLELDKYNF